MFNSKKFPAGVLTVFNLQILGMFAYTIVAALLTLYTTEKLGFSQNSAFAVTAAFYGLVFATSVPGGYIAENYLGYKNAFVISILLAALGTLCMAVSTHAMLYVGLTLFLLGNGIFVPCLYVMLGQIFDARHPQRESAFTLSYIGMNIGGFVAGIISGNLTRLFGYSYVFVLATLVTVLIVLFLPYLFKQLPRENFSISKKIIGIFLLFLTFLVTLVSVIFSKYCNLILLTFGIYCLIYLIWLIFKTHDHFSKKNLIVFTLLFLTSSFFWALSALSYSALTVFAKYNVARNFMGHVVPTADFSGLNPLFIITFGMLVSYLWNKKTIMTKVNFSLIKFAVGFLLAATGFLLLVIGLKTPASTGLIPMHWLFLSYFFQALGELCIGPVGYAIVAKVVSRNIEGRMMGIWQMSSGIGGALSYYFANLSTQGSKNIFLSDQAFMHAFIFFSSTCVILAFVLFAGYYFLQKESG